MALVWMLACLRLVGSSQGEAAGRDVDEVDHILTFRADLYPEVPFVCRLEEAGLGLEVVPLAESPLQDVGAPPHGIDLL